MNDTYGDDMFCIISTCSYDTLRYTSCKVMHMTTCTYTSLAVTGVVQGPGMWISDFRLYTGCDV